MKKGCGRGHPALWVLIPRGTTLRLTCWEKEAFPLTVYLHHYITEGGEFWGKNLPLEHEHFKGQENLKKPLRDWETSTLLERLNEAQIV